MTAPFIAPFTNAPPDTVPKSLADELRKYEARVLGGEGDALRARWECGRRLLPIRKGKQFPKGFLANVAKELSVSERELRHRVQFAEKFSSDEKVGDAVTDFPTWRAMVHDGIPTKRSPKPKTAAHPKVVAAARLAMHRWLKELKGFSGHDFDEAAKRDFDACKVELMRIQEEMHQGAPAAEKVAR